MRQKRDYDLRKLKEIAYSPGDLVWKLYQVRKKGRSFKLESPRKGPFLIIKAQPPLYHLFDQKGKSVIHHDKLTPYLSDVIPVAATQGEELSESLDLPSDPVVPPQSSTPCPIQFEEEGGEPTVIEETVFR